MTENEAIIELKEVMDEEFQTENQEKAYTMAIKALEKQIPKKPEFVDTRFRNHGRHVSDGCSIDKCYKCPNCKSHIFHVFPDENYCEHCGQKLDWGGWK